MKKLKYVLALIIIIFSFSCKNVYNELIPNDEQAIVAFSLSSEDYQTCSVSTDIKKNYITVKMPQGTDVTQLLAQAHLSNQATLFPLTLRYLQEAFPATDVVKLALRMSINPAETSLDKWFLDLYLENPDFKIPPLVFPINFFSPVKFVVIGGQGGVEIYTVKVVYEDGSDPSSPFVPDETEIRESKKNILSFKLPLNQQKGESAISDDAVKFVCKTGIDVRMLLPEVTVSENCIAVPLTREYLLAMADKLNLDVLNVAQGFLTATDKEAFLRATLIPCDISNLMLELDKPIDFAESVQFVVVHREDKTSKLYTVTCSTDATTPYLETIGFSKFQNPQVMKDAVGAIDEANKRIECVVFYPVDWAVLHPEAYKLNMDAGYTGDSVQFEYKGASYAEYDTVPFQPVKITTESHYLGEVVIKVHVLRDSQKVTYTMRISFKEDSNTIRSITDFRFEKFYNVKIKSTAVASIVNRDEEGEIKATVLYAGDAKPCNLIPSFITGGGASASVAGSPQISKQSEQNFSAEVVYLCVSKDKNFKRTYTVKVNFVKVEIPEALMKTFSFGIHLNTGLAGDAIGTIDNTANTITVKVTHTTPIVPEELIPEFSSTGLVSVGSIMQTSGFSRHSFCYSVYYKVTSTDDPSITRTYKVNVTFNYATESKCQLLRFYFTKDDNTSLKEDVECYISATSYNVFALLPYGSDLSSLKPRFEVYGKVKVGGSEQESAVSSQDFSNIVEYVVESEDGRYSKTYNVKVEVAGQIIYLSARAHGKNNGTSWQDAFTTLEDAIEVANKMTASPEIWVQDAGFVGKTIHINKSITLRGGFNGTESNKDERIRENGKLVRRLSLTDVVIEGEYNAKISGNMVFDGISISMNDIHPYFEGVFLKLRWEESAIYNSLTFEDCIVKDTWILPFNCQGGDLFIKNSTFNEGCKIKKGSNDYSIMRIDHVEITDSRIACFVDLFANDINIIDSTAEGETKFEVKENFIFKRQHGSASCTDLTVHLNQEGSNQKIEMVGLQIDKCAFHAFRRRNNLPQIIFKDVEVENIEFSDYWVSVKFEDSIMEHVSSRRRGGYTKNLEIKNCGNKHDIEEQCGNFALVAFTSTVENSYFTGDVDLSFVRGKYSDTIVNFEVHTKIENMQARKFYCGENRLSYQDDEPVFGENSISNSMFEKLYCFGGDSINIDNLKIDSRHVRIHEADENLVILSNLCVPNSKITLRNVSELYPIQLKGEVKCITHNLTVGEKNEDESGVRGFRRIALYGKRSVDVRKSNFNRQEDEEKTVLIAGHEVTFTQNECENQRIEISAGTELNVDGNMQPLNLSLYYPKVYVFDNKKFHSLELLDEPANGSPFDFPSISNQEFNVSNCTFVHTFVNKRPYVNLDDPVFEMQSLYTYKNMRLQAYSYPLKVRGIKDLITMKIENLKTETKAKIILSDSKLVPQEGDYCRNVSHIIEVGNYASLEMENTQASYVTGFIRAGLGANLTISKGCVFENIGMLVNGGGANLKIENNSNDPTKHPKFFIGGEIWGNSFFAYINVGNLEIKNATFEKNYSYLIYNKLETLIMTYNATISHTEFKNIGEMCTVCFEGAIQEMEECNFINAGIVYIRIYKSDVKIKGGKFENTKTYFCVVKQDGSNLILQNIDFFDTRNSITVSNNFSSGNSVDYYGPIAVCFEYEIDNISSEIKDELGVPIVTSEVISNFLQQELFANCGVTRIGYFLNLGNDPPSDTSSKKFYGTYN